LSRQQKALEGQAAVTSGETPVTSGGKPGTSGERLSWAPLAVVAGVSVTLAVLNSTSALMEARAGGEVLDARAPWVYEFSSIIFVIALTPLVARAVALFPPKRGRWLRFVPGHIASATAFSLAHIAGMVALRKLAFGLSGETYIFADADGIWFPLLYEWRKDVLTYAAIAAFYQIWRWLAPRAVNGQGEAFEQDARIEIRDGTRTILIEPGDISWLEAAGNYVEIHAGGASHLARGTLAAFEQKLAGRGFVRVHRSRVVNRKRVAAFKPTPSGDLEITLDDGRTIAGSRRYRAGMENA
jgi:LytTr DNA-binding domain